MITDKPNTGHGNGTNTVLPAVAPTHTLSTDGTALDCAEGLSGSGIGATSEDCPSNEFLSGNPNGQCWGDGHYRCQNCKNYREDFKRLGQDYIDFAHTIQSFKIETL